MKSWPAILLAILLLLLAVVGLLFWQFSRAVPAVGEAPSIPAVEGPMAAEGVRPLPAGPALESSFLPAEVDDSQVPESGDGADRIGAILADDRLENAAVVRRLLALLPNLEEDDQMEAAQHAVNLTDDEDVSLWLRDVLADRYPAPVAEVFFGDLLNRPQEVLFPSLAQMADSPQHSLRQDSEEILEVLFEPRPPNVPWKQWIAQQLQEEN
jgi:hypothetical protein